MSKGKSTKKRIYFPPSESQGGWRILKGTANIEATGGMDPVALADLNDSHLQEYGDHSWAILVIRKGYIVAEYYTFNVLKTTKFDIWSGTKSFAGTAWGLLLHEMQSKSNGTRDDLTLDSPIYQYIPEGHPLSDERKECISVRHLLSMTSGLPGNSAIGGVAADSDHGAIEFALGLSPNRLGHKADKLTAEPGTVWDYSDAAFIHLSLAFSHIAGKEISEYLQERVFTPIGIENICWDVQGGSGNIGPHTNPHTGIHITARDLARFGYLMLQRGRWDTMQIVPEWWINLCTRPSQNLNKHYGYTWWVNASNGTRWHSCVPLDAFSLSGYRCNRCYILPSLDLVVVRLGTGPEQWDEKVFLKKIMECVQ